MENENNQLLTLSSSETANPDSTIISRKPLIGSLFCLTSWISSRDRQLEGTETVPVIHWPMTYDTITQGSYFLPFKIYILGMGKCEFDKDMHKLYIYNSCIFSYHLFYFLSYFCQNGVLNFSLKLLIIRVLLCRYCTGNFLFVLRDYFTIILRITSLQVL